MGGIARQNGGPFDICTQLHHKIQSVLLHFGMLQSSTGPKGYPPPRCMRIGQDEIQSAVLLKYELCNTICEKLQQEYEAIKDNLQ